MPALDYLSATPWEQNDTTSNQSTDKIAKLLKPKLPKNEFDNFKEVTTNPKFEPSASESVIPIHDFIPQIYRSSEHTPTRKEKELQWWYGTITEVLDDSFVANLKDLEGRLNIVEFEKSFVPENSMVE